MGKEPQLVREATNSREETFPELMSSFLEQSLFSSSGVARLHFAKLLYKMLDDGPTHFPGLQSSVFYLWVSGDS